MINQLFNIVGTIVEQDGKYLLVQEGKPGREGRYTFPAGKVDDLETLEQAAIRETFEESGFEVEITGFLGIYQTIYPDDEMNVCGPVFTGKVVGGNATPSVKHPDILWVTSDELIRMYENGKIWTDYPPLAIKDLRSRGSLPKEIASCQTVSRKLRQ